MDGVAGDGVERCVTTTSKPPFLFDSVLDSGCTVFGLFKKGGTLNDELLRSRGGNVKDEVMPTFRDDISSRTVSMFADGYCCL